MAQRTIIYAEDDKAQRESMTELLELYGFQVRPHANGKLALDDIVSLQATGQRVLLLTDYNMPVMDGIELIKGLSDAKVRVPTIVLSANIDVQANIEKLGLTGAVDKFLDKPVQAQILTEAFRSVSAKHDILANPNTPLDFASRASDIEMMR
jgi:FixJ family two-component response regulator